MTVCRAWNQADVALAVAPAGVVARDRDDAGVFALRARVELHADGLIAVFNICV